MKTFCLLVVLFFSQLLFAQDTLYQVNGNKQLITTLKINSGVLYYRTYPPTDSSTNLLSLDLVKRLSYSNGIVFEPVQKKGVVSPKLTPKLKYTNAISINCYDLFFPVVTVAYEKFSKTGTYSLKVPLSIGRYSLTQNEDYKVIGAWDNDPYFFGGKVFSTGLGYYYYPRGQGGIKPYLGGGMEGGLVNYLVPLHNTSAQEYNECKGNFYAVLFNTGANSILAKRILIQYGVGVGMQYSKTKVSTPNRGILTETHITGVFRGQLSIGYLF